MSESQSYYGDDDDDDAGTVSVVPVILNTPKNESICLLTETLWRMKFIRRKKRLLRRRKVIHNKSVFGNDYDKIS